MSAHPSEEKLDPTGRRSIACSIVVVLIAVFVLQNTRSGTIHVLARDIRAPARAWLVGVFACGLLAGWLPRSLRRSRSGSQ
jgi:uncharacterized integral membrane protein